MLGTESRDLCGLGVSSDPPRLHSGFLIKASDLLPASPHGCVRLTPIAAEWLGEGREEGGGYHVIRFPAPVKQPHAAERRPQSQLPAEGEPDLGLLGQSVPPPPPGQR